MIFHQGESDNGQASWPMRVKTVVDRLRSDLGIGAVPFVVGELLYTPSGCCGSHNRLVNELPELISNTAVAKADGLSVLATDGFGNVHFDVASQRTLGKRYGQAMLMLLARRN
jgi:hypothetical protein